MKRTFVFVISVSSLVACATPTPESPASAGQIPVAMQCPGSMDPNQACPTPSEPAIPVTRETLKSPKLERAEKVQRTVTGRCELVIEGEKNVQPCTALKVELRAVDGSEVRPVLIDGYNLRALDLSRDRYKVMATSSRFEISPNAQTIEPGQIVKIRIQGKRVSR